MELIYTVLKQVKLSERGSGGWKWLLSKWIVLVEILVELKGFEANVNILWPYFCVLLSGT